MVDRTWKKLSNKDIDNIIMEHKEIFKSDDFGSKNIFLIKDGWVYK